MYDDMSITQIERSEIESEKFQRYADKYREIESEERYDWYTGERIYESAEERRRSDRAAYSAPGRDW